MEQQKERRQLAIDATKENYEEALRYSELVRDFFGNKTFSLSDLKEAIEDLPADESIYLGQEYHLYNDDDENEIEFPNSIKKKAEKCLYALNKNYFFLTESKIEHLQELNDNVLANPKYSSEYNQLIQDADLSVRVRNALTRKGIETVGNLLEYSPKELLMIRNFGPKCLREIEEFLDEIFD